MRLHTLGHREKTGYTTWGCMWEQGKCTENTEYVLKNADGTPVLMQTRITAYWPDGSVKWTAHTADAAALDDEIEVLPAQEADAAVSFGANGTCESGAEQSIVVEKDSNGNGVEYKGEHKDERKDAYERECNRGSITVHAGALDVEISKESNHLFESAFWQGKPFLKHAEPVLLLEQPVEWDGNSGKLTREYTSRIKEVSIEDEGAVQVTVKYVGYHEAKNGETRFPFVIRMKIGFNSKHLDFTHTFMYDGDEDKDFLKGLGIRFQVPQTGKVYNRHVKFMGDYGTFHESLANLLSWRPRVPQEMYAAQIAGEKLEPVGKDEETVNTVLRDMPFWSEYDFCQDSVSHFGIRKKIKADNCCYLDCLQGTKSEGGAAFGSESGSVMFSIRDFWEKYPSGYTFRDLTEDTAQATVWFWSPAAQAMDFRHYANRGYNQVYYEGYDYKGATPYGIACTNECSVAFSQDIIPTDAELSVFTENVKHPVQYVADPEFYHKMRAFGYWSLPSKESEMENWLEEQLDRAVEFYKNEVKQRNWYGMFNYGDFMHTYDKERHMWRYDMGGYAWDNTELVPTLWLWYAFMRSGREDIFVLAEKLSRHASEVDVYHMGKYKGLGSRHNVRHWGCPCKEARIAMAAHHRFYYYMTGDRRLEDIFDELKDNEMTFLNKDPLGDFYDKNEMVYPSHARSGPDWSSLCANWITQWERFHDGEYREKIEIGMTDIKNAPLKLVSGPDFEFDPKSVHLRYIGERAAGGTHLQICMGAPQVWMEMADLLEDEEWKRMMAEYGRFYYLPREQQLQESNGLIGEREFSLPFMAAAMGAYGASYLHDEVLAERTWRHLLHALVHGGNHDGMKSVVLQSKGNQENLVEIPWISTNFTAQWCLNVIVVLEFIREALPKTLEETDKLVEGMPENFFRKA